MRVQLKNKKQVNVVRMYDSTYTDCMYQNMETKQIYHYDQICQILEPDDINKICLLNMNGGYPNILHFQGSSKQRYIEGNLFKVCITDMETVIHKPYDLTIITIYTDKDQCYLCKQDETHHYGLVNAAEDFHPTEWNMTYKISLLINALEKITTSYVLILDGYDVLIQNLDNIIPKFLEFETRILFNASKNNFPDVHIDKIYARDARGAFRFFNAGCCIGYSEDVLNFYRECLAIKDTLDNQFNSEQFVLRHVFAKYSEELTNEYYPSYIEFDYECYIFQTFGNTMLVRQDEENENLKVFKVT